MNKYFIATDFHLGHANMIDYCHRPQSFEDLIFAAWDKLPDDCTLIFLGDFCIGRDEYWHELFLAGRKFKKILVRGNHDRKSTSWYSTHGWDFVCDTFSLNVYGRKILFSHEPHKIDGYNLNIFGHLHNHLPRLLRKEWAVPDEEERNKGVLSVLTPFHKLLACEINGYAPVSLRSFVEKPLDKKT